MTGDPQDAFEVLITAEEAWPALERAVLNAEREFIAGFRLFDLSTRLRSQDARRIGTDWFDLLCHALRRGVRVNITVSDFDPVMATGLHEQAWRTVRQGAALAELSGAGPGQLRIRAALHPARAGWLPWLALLPVVLGKDREARAELDVWRKRRQAVGLRAGRFPRLHTVSHHQKMAVIDGTWLYIGGLDLNERRWDTRRHEEPADRTWSDVQVMMRGPEAAEARAHLLEFTQVTSGAQAARPMQHILRTLSAPRRLQFPFLSPRTCVSEIETAHVQAFRRARHLVYIETQFLRSSRLAEALAEAAMRNADLTAFIILPALPQEVSFEQSDSLDVRYGLALKRQAIETLQGAFGSRLTLASPVKPVMAARDGPDTHAGSPIIHVHNKVLMVDDDYLLIGSANLNGRSMRWDTEVAVQRRGAERVRRARHALAAHWWFTPDMPGSLDPARLHADWSAATARNGLCLPGARTGFLVPHDERSADHLEQALPGVTENIV